MSLTWPRQFSCDILLLIPPCGKKIFSMENIGVESIAAYARSVNLKTEIINSGLHGLDEKEVLAILLKGEFKVLAISLIHWTYISGLWLAKEVKRHKPGVRVILGGLEAGLRAREILERHPFIDAVGTGEGELLTTAYCRATLTGAPLNGIPGLVYRTGGAVSGNPPQSLISDLDALPCAVRDDIRSVVELGGPVAISTSRGCFGNCHFCSVRAFYKLSRGRAWRGRSPEAVVQEIAAIKRNYGADLFAFIDETVAGPGEAGLERLEKIADLIVREKLDIEFFAAIRADQVTRRLFSKLKKAGLAKVEIGIESMSAAQLGRLGKSTSIGDNSRALSILDELGISCEEFMIPFDPEASLADIDANLEFFEARFLRAKKHGRYTVAPLLMGQFVYPYTGTLAHRAYAAHYRDKKKFYFDFYAVDPTVELGMKILNLHLNATGPAFPLSYSGLGNLWRKKRAVSAQHYRSVAECAADFGLLNVGYMRFLLSYLERKKRGPYDLDYSELKVRMSGYFSESEKLRKQLRRIVSHYSRRVRMTGRITGPENAFSSMLRHYSGPLKRGRIRAMLEERVDPRRLEAEVVGLLEFFYPKR